ncbi:MATE family efflux transporter [Azotosporobacter soli]|uniref:MATE family efflux transporter n=1 Tax=Azotosporobacter soli TaxID=3055040 RepID=UPI0031FE7574
MEHPNALGEESVGRLLWKFSVPAITGMVVNALYNIVDSVFVGRGVGELGLAAVTIAFPLVIVLMGFGMLVGVGASARISICLGQKDKAMAELILGNATGLLFLLAAGLTAALLVFLDPLLMLLGATPELLPMAREFTRVLLLGSIFMYLSFGLNSVIRAQGHPKTAMATMLIAAGLNVVLNPIFIFGLHLGISGSALATVIAQAVAAFWVLLFLRSEKSFLKLHWKNLKPKRSIVAEIVSIGSSPFLMQIAASVVGVLFNHSLILYSGELGVAAMGIINRVAMLLVMPVFGISQGAQPIIGYNFGANNFQRVKETLYKAGVAATLICCAAFLIVQIFDESIIRLFNGNEELIAIGAFGMRIYLFMLPIIGFQVVCTTYFQAVGKARQAIFLSLSRQFVFLLPLVLLLPRFFGLTGIWLAGPAADLVSSLLTGALLWLEFRHLNRMSL